MAGGGASGDRVQIVVFWLGDTEFGVPVDQVHCIERLTVATRVPRAPDFLEGVVNIRGDIVPVVDLKKRFGLAPTPYTDKARVVVVMSGGQLVGMMVDAVREIVWFPTSQIDAPQGMIADIAGVYLTGVGCLADRRIILLNLDQVLAIQQDLPRADLVVQGNG